MSGLIRGVMSLLKKMPKAAKKGVKEVDLADEVAEEATKKSSKIENLSNTPKQQSKAGKDYEKEIEKTKYDYYVTKSGHNSRNPELKDADLNDIRNYRKQEEEADKVYKKFEKAKRTGNNEEKEKFLRELEQKELELQKTKQNIKRK